MIKKLTKKRMASQPSTEITFIFYNYIFKNKNLIPINFQISQYEAKLNEYYFLILKYNK
jgi:hypothetical protein